MNWYKTIKIATLNFSIEGTDKISQPMTTHNILYDLLNFIPTLNISGKIGLDAGNEVSVNAATGEIKLYMSNEINANTMVDIIYEYNQYRAGQVELTLLEFDETSEVNFNNTTILVSENETSGIEQIPKAKVSIHETDIFLRMLYEQGMLIDLNFNSGTLDINQLEKIINKLEQNENLIRPYTDENMTNPGQGLIPLGKLKVYFFQLKNMINYIRKNNLPNKVIKYELV